jgi:hypothetical protein
MNSEIHSSTAVWSLTEPPTTYSLPFKFFTSRASPKVAIVSNSLIVCHEVRINFMRAGWPRGLDIGGHNPAPREKIQSDQIQLFQGEDFRSGSLASTINCADGQHLIGR